MKVMRKEIIPAREEKRLDYIQCELCGVKTKNEDWTESAYDVKETKVSYREGNSYPDGGQGEKTIVDICPECFKNKLLVWLKSQGAVSRTELWDW